MNPPLSLNPVNDFVCISIRRLRQSRGLGIEEMARRAGIPCGSYSCLETGRYRLNLENLFRILAALEVEIADVWPQPPPQAASQLNEADIDEAVARAESRRPPRARIEDLLAAVCRTCFVTRRELRSRRRGVRLSRARAIAAFLVRESGHLTLSGLSRSLGRDVSSISHQLRRFRQRLDKDTDSAVILRQTRGKLEDLLRRRHLRRLRRSGN